MGYIKQIRDQTKMKFQYHGMTMAVLTTRCGLRLDLGPGDNAQITITDPTWGFGPNAITVASAHGDTRIFIDEIKSGDVIHVCMAQFDDQTDYEDEAMKDLTQAIDLIDEIAAI